MVSLSSYFLFLYGHAFSTSSVVVGVLVLVRDSVGHRQISPYGKIEINTMLLKKETRVRKGNIVPKRAFNYI
jgi:hypothetical protein